MITLQLQALGLSEKEVLLYLALADAGKSTASFLSRVCRLPRATVYFVLEGMLARGLVIKEQKKNTYYSACDPTALVRLAEREQEQATKKVDLAHELISQLTPLFRSEHFHVPKMQFYEGKETLENMLYQNIDQWRASLKQFDFTWWGYEDKTLTELYQPWFDWYWKHSAPREHEKVRLFSNARVANELSATFPDSILRPVPQGYDFSSTIWILGDFIVLIMTRHEPHYAFQIKDSVFARNLSLVFKLLWGQTEMFEDVGSKKERR